MADYMGSRKEYRIMGYRTIIVREVYTVKADSFADAVRSLKEWNDKDILEWEHYDVMDVVSPPDNLELLSEEERQIP